MKREELVSLFGKKFHHDPEMIVQAPGRVNLLGEHVDYNDGIVLPAAINRSVFIASSPQENDCVTLYAIDLDDSTSFHLSDLERKTDITGNSLPNWALYPAGVAWALKNAGLSVSGVKAIITSNIPIGAGLSSSAALEVAFGTLWQAIEKWDLDSLSLARICQKAENDYVGLSCGLMDQFASACGVEGHALYFDIRSLDWEAAPLPHGTALIIADSGQRRALTNSAYNDRRASCEEAVKYLQEYLPNIQSLRDVTPTEFAALSAFIPEIPRKRAEHIVKEIARVESALSALQRNDKKAFGALMYSGHNSLRDLYEVSTPELDLLVELTRKIPGCIGARLTGAGFGGCTINLVEEQNAEEFIKKLKAEYQKATGNGIQVYLCKASQGASDLDKYENSLNVDNQNSLM